MTDWILFDGLVILNSLRQRGFWRLLRKTPAIFVAVYLLIPLRMEKRRARILLLGLYGIFWCCFLLSNLTGTPVSVSIACTQVLDIVQNLATPFFFTKYRDSRTVFLILTIYAINIQADALAWLLLGAGAPVKAAYLLMGLLILGILTLICRWVRTNIWSIMYQQKDGWLMYSSIPLLVSITLALFRSYPNPLATGNSNSVGVVLVVSLQAVVYRVLFENMRARIERERLRQNAALSELQLHMAEEQARQLMLRIQKDAVNQHDQRHFRQVILAYLDANDTEGAKAVLRKQQTLSKKAVETYCEDPVINQLIAHYAHWAKSEQIDFDIDARLPVSDLKCRSKLMVILCNALENAIHACAGISDADKRRIRLVLHSKGKQIYLEVFNTYEGDMTLDPVTGLPCTDQPGHGYGLQSIAALAELPPNCSVEDNGFTLWMLV